MTSQVLSTQETKSVDAWVRLLRGHAATRRILSGQLQSDHDLTVNDYEAMLLISRAEEGSMRRVDLAHELQLTASGVTRLLDGLQKRGLVDKASCASDARVTYAVLTPAGRQKLKQASGTHIAGIRALFEEHYTTEELSQLAELLSRLPGVAGANAEDCAAGERAGATG